MADIMREISALLGFLTGGVDPGSAVDCCTIWKAAWFTSDGLVANTLWHALSMPRLPAVSK